MPTATPARRIPTKWQKLLRMLPGGYDPIATAEDAFFIPRIAEYALDFFPECLKHIEGDLYGKPFVLEPWQQSIIANLFGWYLLDDKGREVRRYREMLLYVPKKGGKTPLCAGIALLVLFCRQVDGEKGQQDYIAAADKLQAGKLFRYAQAMVKAEPELLKRCRIYGGNASAGQTKSIVIEGENSFLQILSADADTKEGNTSHLVMIDELHVQPDRRLVDSLTTSLASENRKQPLVVYLTTADYDRLSICNEVYGRACKVRDGSSKNSRFLPVIYEAPTSLSLAQYVALFQRPVPEDLSPEATQVVLDYTDPMVYRHPTIWAMANPNLGVSVSRAYLETDSQKAFETPGYLPTFLRLHLNVRTQASSAWLDLQRWDASAGEAVPAMAMEREGELPDGMPYYRVVASEESLPMRLQGRQCWGGLDLGSTSDLTSLCLLFPEDDGSYQALWWHWVPEVTAKKRENKGDVAYLDFVQRGYLLTTPGDETDYEEIFYQINSIGQDYGIVDIAVDRDFQGAQLCQDLGKAGFEMVPWGFGFRSMAAPTQEFERLVNRGALHHGGNPVVRWAVGHVMVDRDPTDNMKPDKAKSKDKIDPLVSAIIALGRAMLRPKDTGSVYETRGLIVL